MFDMRSDCEGMKNITGVFFSQNLVKFDYRAWFFMALVCGV